MAEQIGTPTPRVDGHAKVSGAARYASDFPVARPAFAFLVTSPIARGRIAQIDESETRSLSGVIEVLTYKNVGKAIRGGETFAKHGYMGTSIAPLASEKIWHDGQIVGVVLADTFETARDGAHRLQIRYAEEKPSATFGSPGAQEVGAKQVSKEHQDPQVGDAAKAFREAPIKVDQEYATPTQHHNPIELFATTCAWQDGKLTIWEGSQNVYGYKNGVAEQLSISPDQVQAISPFIGGAFGSRGSLTQRTAIIAFAAKKIGRPVKLVATRDQGFTIATYRAETK